MWNCFLDMANSIFIFLINLMASRLYNENNLVILTPPNDSVRFFIVTARCSLYRESSSLIFFMNKKFDAIKKGRMDNDSSANRQFMAKITAIPVINVIIPWIRAKKESKNMPLSW